MVDRKSPSTSNALPPLGAKVILFPKPGPSPQVLASIAKCRAVVAKYWPVDDPRDPEAA